MSKRDSVKYKIDRRIGENLWGRPKSPVNRRSYPPGQHGQRRRNKLSDFGIQLRAKQKLKGFYGDISEKQFHKIYEKASQSRGDTSENLIGILESRLDTIIYRSKFVPTIFSARQFVNHGHISVNGRKTNIRSYICKPGDVIEIREKAKKYNIVLESSSLSERDVPDYISVDYKKLEAVYTRIPKLNDIPYSVQMEPNLVIEFYSR